MAEESRAECAKQEEARDVRERDVKHADAGGDDQAEGPDHEVRGEIIAELMAQHGDTIGRSEKEDRDREVGRVPQVILAIPQHVLGGDGEEPA